MCAIEIFSIISTHDLTKRSTFQLREMNLTETFQLTTSRRGRHYRRSQSHIPISISTHDLTKRSTAIFPPIKTNGAFQLTTSRRGRQLNTELCNTRAEAFQLTTSRRGRPSPSMQADHTYIFQLTTSRRGRRKLVARWNL